MPERKTETYIRPNTEGYVQGWSSVGKRTKINGDVTSVCLNAMDNEEVKSVLAKLDPEADVNAYDERNTGQIRMMLGNKIRGHANRARKEYLAEHEGDETGADEHAADVLEKAVGKQLRRTVDKRIAGFEKAAEERASKKEAEAA